MVTSSCWCQNVDDLPSEHFRQSDRLRYDDRTDIEFWKMTFY